jgi:hypothetical protein
MIPISEVGISRESITESFRSKIQEFYAVTHDVNFDNIKRSCCDNYLIYEGNIPRNVEGSVYSQLSEVFHEDFSDRKTEYLAKLKPYDELLELADIYESQIKRESDIECDKIMDICKKYLKFTARKKIKQLLNLDKDGNFVEVEQINYKLSIINKFNKDKYNHIQSYLKKNGKTIRNFSIINYEWDQNNKENLKLGRMSDELKTDMATSGYNDKLV